MSDYDKIMQLVRSDDTNNRLLGFQLAKGSNIDLIKLIDNVPNIPIHHGQYIIVGDIQLEWEYIPTRKGIRFRTKNDYNTVHSSILSDKIMNEDKNALEETTIIFKKLFINLITE